MDEQKLSELDEKIKAAKNVSKINPQPTKPENNSTTQSDNMSQGMRASMEFVVSVVGGTLIGVWIDTYFGTKPLFLIALFFLGVITGFVNIWRVTEGHGSAIGFKNLNKDKQSEDKDA